MTVVDEEWSAEIGYPNISDGFLIDEDNAMRQHLLGLNVYDDTGKPRPVGVWFSHPEMETREQKYPYAVINLIDVTEAKNRVMSGYGEGWVPALSFPMDMLPSDVILDEATRRLYNGEGAWNDLWLDKSSFPLTVLSRPPVPVQVDYQIRAFSRHPRHDRQILAGFLGKKVPYRYGWLDMQLIDGTTRRLELLDIGHSEAVEAGKRLFVSTFTVRVDSYMPVGEVQVYEGQYVTKVLADLKHHIAIDEAAISEESFVIVPPTNPQAGNQLEGVSNG